MPAHSAPRPRGVPLSRPTWQRVRRTVTVGLFVAATATGVTVGLHGASVSPVAAAPTDAAVVLADGEPAPDQVLIEPAPGAITAAPDAADGDAPTARRHGRGGRR